MASDFECLLGTQNYWWVCISLSSSCYFPHKADGTTEAQGILVRLDTDGLPLGTQLPSLYPDHFGSSSILIYESSYLSASGICSVYSIISYILEIHWAPAYGFPGVVVLHTWICTQPLMSVISYAHFTFPYLLVIWPLSWPQADIQNPVACIQ